MKSAIIKLKICPKYFPLAQKKRVDWKKVRQPDSCSGVSAIWQAKSGAVDEPARLPFAADPDAQHTTGGPRFCPGRHDYGPIRTDFKPVL